MGLLIPKGLEQIVARGPQHQQVVKGLLTKPEAIPEGHLGQRFITYKEWMEDTALDWRHPRSAKLKALDEALKNHEKANYSTATLRKLRVALNDWIRWKGVDSWKQSKRNNEENNWIFERLRLLAFAPGLPPLMSKSEMRAFEVLEEARKEALHTLFKDKRVRLKIIGQLKNTKLMFEEVKVAAQKFKRDVRVAHDAVLAARDAPLKTLAKPRDFKKNTREVLGHGREFNKAMGNLVVQPAKKGVETVVSGISNIYGQYSNVKNVVDIVQGVGQSAHVANLTTGIGAVGDLTKQASSFVLNDLMNLPKLNTMEGGLAWVDLNVLINGLPDLLKTISADFVPFLSLGTGAISCVTSWIGVATKAHAAIKTKQAKYVIEKGDPQKAFNAIMGLLKLDVASQTVEAVKTTAVYATQVAGTFVDMGAATAPCIAAAKTAADLVQKLLIFATELVQVIKANNILKHPEKLDFRLFEEYPLAGCYMIRCATLSDIIAMSTVQFGNPGWMDDIEDMKKKYIDPMIKHCDRFIKDSLFEIPNMPKMPSDEMKEKAKMAKKAMKGKKLTGISSTDYFAQNP